MRENLSSRRRHRHYAWVPGGPARNSTTRRARLATAVGVLVTTICGNVLAVNSRHAPITSKRASSSDLVVFPNSSYTATVFGRITDPNGDPIPKATVRLRNLRTSQQLVVQSNKRGEYHLLVTELGECKLDVEAQYFHNLSQFLELHLEDELRLDVSMMVGEMVGVVVIETIRGKGFEIDGAHVRIN